MKTSEEYPRRTIDKLFGKPKSGSKEWRRRHRKAQKYANSRMTEVSYASDSVRTRAVRRQSPARVLWCYGENQRLNMCHVHRVCYDRRNAPKHAGRSDSQPQKPRQKPRPTNRRKSRTRRLAPATGCQRARCLWLPQSVLVVATVGPQLLDVVAIESAGSLPLPMPAVWRARLSPMAPATCQVTTAPPPRKARRPLRKRRTTSTSTTSTA